MQQRSIPVSREAKTNNNKDNTYDDDISYTESCNSISKRKDNCTIMLSPLDKLRLELDDIWPCGSRVGRDSKGRALVAGLTRLMKGPTKSIQGFCHVDDISPLSIDCGLFSANIYTQLPYGGGGALQIWPIEVWNRWEFYTNSLSLTSLMSQDSVKQSELQRKFKLAGIEPQVILPEVGDCILICAQRPHAVQGFPVGFRISLQSFLTFQGTRKEILIDN